MKNFEQAIWYEDNVSRAQVLRMDDGDLLICFTSGYSSGHFRINPIDAEKLAANILAGSMTSQIKDEA